MKYVTPSARTYKYEAFLAVNCDTILHVVQMEDLKKMVSSTYLILDNGTCTYNKAVCNCNPSTLMYNQINSVLLFLIFPIKMSTYVRTSFFENFHMLSSKHNNKLFHSRRPSLKSWFFEQPFVYFSAQK